MPQRIPALAITAYTATSAVGHGTSALAQALKDRRSGLTPNDFTTTALACWIGRVEGVEAVAIPPQWAHWDCRNNRLAWLGLHQDGLRDACTDLLRRHGARRVALVLGTSTASIGATEAGYRTLDAQGAFAPAFRDPMLHTPHSLAAFVQAVLGTRGPVATVATACSSSAKVFAQAERLIRLGWADAAIVGGVDTLCDSVLFGFNALQLVSPDPCRPFDAARSGISIGEAAGFAILERADAAPSAPRLIGWGESSDAHHMSSPHPEGLGARLAITDALARAGLGTEQVDYVNMHGTATPANDAVEAAVVAAMFPATTRASSTKGWTGHALGAAGIVEAVATLTAMREGFVPGSLHCTHPDRACGPQLALGNETRDIQVALSNSFGFGGNNAALLFGQGDPA
ncbi:beta-ketoacyl-ACP synthase [Tahibacter amnicola]|uniref:Beta-ketoacyl-ACP synthase n=1 Tax=Tahibacter amnicola TaxID=2976241 RepID=A0ABY6BH96_9GAMM|nr:beta-ketoacyl-ACP synthase [Tahibacter amnicola]UXI68698.1 beta-ketoacyl-ACP synthase [Tahibacter amnicola]